MRFVIPDNIGGDLRVLPSDSYDAEIVDIYLGESAAHKPKATVKYLITSDYTGKKSADYKTTVGENALETFSLQPQALFNINGLYKSVTGKNIPQGDYDEQGLLTILKDALLGQRFKLKIVETANPTSGEPMSKVDGRQFMPRTSRSGRGK